MKLSDGNLITPIYVKTPNMLWPKDRVFYLLTSDGLFLCRNHEFFTSSAPARDFPTELEPHASFLRLRYPKVPQPILELVVGYFWEIGRLYGAEAAVLLAWNRTARCVELIIPDQVSKVYENRWGDVFPIDCHYEIPNDLPADTALIGDIHSHVEDAAYASFTDKNDESYRPGLHIVVGRIHREPPEFHIEATVDGKRFAVKPEHVFEGYRKRRKVVPPAWIEKVKIEGCSSLYQQPSQSGGTQASESNPSSTNNNSVNSNSEKIPSLPSPEGDPHDPLAH